MDTPITSPARPAAGAFDAREEAMLPARMESHGLRDAHAPTGAKRTWLRVALRVARNAAIAVALMASVPILIVATRGDGLWSRMSGLPAARARVSLAEASRSLMLPRDPSITPMLAGLALHRVQAPTDIQLKTDRYAAVFSEVKVDVHPAPPWKKKFEPDMFVSASPTFIDGPSSASILEAVSKEFSPKEMAYLREIANAPQWRDFDLVARAPAVDVIGGRFNFPFAHNAAPEFMPGVNVKETRTLAHVAVSRAAYHMANGNLDSAETILRSVVSFGFVMIDNGTSLMDQLLGNISVNIGRDGLRRFYTIMNDARAASPAVAEPPRVKGQTEPPPKISAAERRKAFIAAVNDPSVSRAERFETVRVLAASSCTNVRELLFGQRSDIGEAIRGSRTSLAKYPSDVALIELLSRPLLQGVDENAVPGNMLAVSSATVAGVVLNNPRLASCTRILTSMGGS